MSGAQIAAEVALALAEAGTEVGTGPVVSTIRRYRFGNYPAPWDGVAQEAAARLPDYYEITGVEELRETEDMTKSLTGNQKRVLIVSATGIAPLKSDTIAVGVPEAGVTSATTFEEILQVDALAPGGVPLLYELHLSI